VCFPLKNVEREIHIQHKYNIFSQMKANFLTMAFSIWQSDQCKEFSEVTHMSLIFALSSEQCDFRHKERSVVLKLKIEPK